MSSIRKLERVRDEAKIRGFVEREYERTGGIFRLAPTWVGRPGIIIPGRRIKLLDDYMSQEVAVNERWLASATYADNGVYNKVCPEDHGLSYLVMGGVRIQLKDALAACGDLLLGKGRSWSVLPKFFDNWHRIPNHIHPCDDHCAPGLVGKPESYHFPLELNMNRNAFPASPYGVDPTFTDAQVLSHLRRYLGGDNRFTDLSSTVNLTPGTGWFMPPCTLHAPGSLVTYELQTASDVSCIPESRVNDMVMPVDMVDRDLPVKIKDHGMEKVAQYILGMLRCRNSGNADNFRREYFRPPVSLRRDEDGSQEWIIYRTGRAREASNPDLYSAKRTGVAPGRAMDLHEGAAFGAVILRGHGRAAVPGAAAVNVESASMFADRDTLAADEIFVAEGAAAKLRLECAGAEELALYMHFSAGSNPASRTLAIPEYLPFG
jgi:hypothetical protein